MRVALVLSLVWCGACSHPSAPSATEPTPAVVATPPVADPPELSCPGAVTATAPTSAGAPVTYEVPGTDKGQGSVTVECNPAPGTTFPVGTTSVECVATDSLNRKGSCSFAVNVAPPARLRVSRIMAFGDSITAGQIIVPGTDNVELLTVPDKAYPFVLSQLLSARYPEQRIAVTNRGRPTERAELALSRFVSVFREDSPEAVVLLEGYNDLIFAETSVLGLQAAEQGVNALAAEARLRGARVFICTLSPTKPGRRQIPMSSIQAENDRLRVAARGEGAYLIDVFSALLPDVDGNVSSDGLHLTETGYRRLGETVFAAIRADLEVK